MKRSYILAAMAAVMAIFSCAKEEVPVETLSLNASEVVIEVGGAYTFEASIYPEQAQKSLLVWTSSNPEVATVENGVVRALKVGETIIKVQASSGVSTTCTVLVTPAVTGVNLPKELSLDKGKTVTLTPSFLPEGAATLNVRWESVNPAVATVDANGTVTAVSVGESKIRAIVVNVAGETLVGECVVTVLGGAVGVSLATTTLDMLVGGEVEVLEAVLDPANANKFELEWTSSDPSVVTVERDTESRTKAFVTAVGPGEAVVTVSLDGSETAVATCTINVVQTVSGIELNKESTVIEKGETETLVATVLPENASNQSITWASTVPEVATVDQNGVVTAVAVGQTVISVMTQDGGKIAYCNVTVNQKVTSVALNITKKTLRVGVADQNTVQLSAVVGPEDASNKKVTWSSNNPSIATVDQNGLVTAVAGGSAVIMVTTEDQSKTATCLIESVQPVLSLRLEQTEVKPNPGYSAKINAILNEGAPAASNTKIHWSSDDENVATVDENGNVTAVAVGGAVITAYSDDDNTKIAVCAVTVSWNVTGVILNASKVNMVVGGRNFTLQPTVVPDNATDKSVSWTTSDASVVSVEGGVLTAVGEGTAVVTVTTNDQNCTAECIVVVRPAGSTGSEGFEGSDSDIPWN